MNWQISKVRTVHPHNHPAYITDYMLSTGYVLDKRTAVAWSYDGRFWVAKHYTQGYVEATRRHHGDSWWLQTTADGTPDDNLLNLPRF